LRAVAVIALALPTRSAGILRMAAMSLGRPETALGAFHRRLASPLAVEHLETPSPTPRVA
jgi:hypothetical protein